MAQQDDDQFLLEDAVLDGLLGEFAAAHGLVSDRSVSGCPNDSLALCQFDVESSQWARTSTNELVANHLDSHGDIETASETASQSSSDLSRSSAKKPLTNSTRERMKQELSYLRSKVVALEHELQTLQHTNTDKENTDNNNTLLINAHSIIVGATPQTSVLWERVARHQRVEKQKAERQNAELRQALEDQLKIAKSLEKVLKKRPSAMLPLSLQDDLDDFVATNKRLCTSTGSELSSFASLTARADASYRELDAIWDRVGFATCKRERNDTQVLLNSANRLYLEVINAKLVPFSLEMTNHAAWMCLSQPRLKFLNGVYRSVSADADAIHAESEMWLKMGISGEARMRLVIVTKRFVETDRVVLVLESSSVSGGSKDMLSGLQVVEKGWVVLEKVKDEQTGAESTLIQVCMRLTPAVAETVASSRLEDATTGALTDLILAAFHQNLGFLYQTIENLLVDQMFKLP